MKNTFFAAAYCVVAFTANSKEAFNASLSFKSHSRLCFVENKGQVRDQNNKLRSDVDFNLHAAAGLAIFVGNGAIHYQYSRLDKKRNAAYRMDVTLVGANKNARVIKEEKLEYYERYSTDGSQLVADAFTKITYKDIYTNIDWILSVKNGHLEYEFKVKEGGNPADIQIKYEGATNLALNADGSFTATTPLGIITEQAPVSYQSDGQKVPTKFRLKQSTLTYAIDDYEGALLIDPLLSWGTYFGGTDLDYGYMMATDGSGNVYMSGYTKSTSAIATTGAYKTVLAGGNDAFLAKFSNTGTLLWATYFGGSGDDRAFNLALDGLGNIYMVGGTNSTSGIATAGAYHTTSNSDDAFLAKFSSSGSLLWATYFGGPSWSDDAYGVATDASGNVFIGGHSLAPTGVATTGAYQTSNAGSYDAFVAKFNSSGAIQWATYYGGPNKDYFYGLATDASGKVYLTGSTNSTTGVATTGSSQPSNAGGYDAYIACFTSTGGMSWATYFGGLIDETAQDIALDGSGNIFITGETKSFSGIATSGAHDTTHAGATGTNDAFLAKFSNTGSKLWVTFYGDAGDDQAIGVAVEPSGNIDIVGWTNSTSSIATTDGYQTTFGGGTYDAFLARFGPGGNRQWGTYFGGPAAEYTFGVEATATGDMYISGYTFSSTAIATAGVHQTTLGSTQDAFLAKFSLPASMGAVNTVSPSFTIYPNPTGGIFTVSSAFNGTIVLSNILGQEVMRSVIKCPETILEMPGNLPAGTYICKYQSETGEATSTLIVLER